MVESGYLVAAAATFALAAGYFFVQGLMAWMRRRRPAGLLRKDMEARTWLVDALREGPVELVLAYAERVTWRLSAGSPVPGSSGCGEGPLEERRMLRAAGLEPRVSSEGMRRVRFELALGFSACGALLGSCFSGALLTLFSVCGFCVGWRLPSWSLAKRVKERAEQAERHLPEMLDVISLGLRSGLSFDAALDAYCEHFHTLLACELGLAKEQWERSLITRDEALGNVAALFDSPALKRVLDDISRSLRFGSSLTGSLDSVAVQVRREYRARKEEEVAKAPVKMMVPTGVLILPAMLILVLGPVMLELMVGL